MEQRQNRLYYFKPITTINKTMENKTYKCLEDYVMYDGRTAFIQGKEYSFVENIGKSEIHDIHDMQDETEFYRYFKQIPEPNQPIQSPDADNTERGGRPSIKDYFPESFGVMDILPIYESQPELFNYAKALDRYIDDIENPTPPTLLNELRELNAKYIKWANNIEQVGDIEERPVLKREIAVLKGIASDLDAIIQSNKNKPAI